MTACTAIFPEKDWSQALSSSSGTTPARCGQAHGAVGAQHVLITAGSCSVRTPVVTRFILTTRRGEVPDSIPNTPQVAADEDGSASHDHEIVEPTPGPGLQNLCLSRQRRDDWERDAQRLAAPEMVGYCSRIGSPHPGLHGKLSRRSGTSGLEDSGRSIPRKSGSTRSSESGDMCLFEGIRRLILKAPPPPGPGNRIRAEMVLSTRHQGIMDGCKARARDAGLRFQDVCLVYIGPPGPPGAGPEKHVPTCTTTGSTTSRCSGKGNTSCIPPILRTVVNTRPASPFNDNNPTAQV